MTASPRDSRDRYSAAPVGDLVDTLESRGMGGGLLASPGGALVRSSDGLITYPSVARLVLTAYRRSSPPAEAEAVEWRRAGGPAGR